MPRVSLVWSLGESRHPSKKLKDGKTEGQSGTSYPGEVTGKPEKVLQPGHGEKGSVLLSLKDCNSKHQVLFYITNVALEMKFAHKKL